MPNKRRDFQDVPVYIVPESRDHYQRQRPIVLDYQPQSARDYSPANGLPPARRHSAQDYQLEADYPPVGKRRPASDYLPAGRHPSTKDYQFEADYPPAGKRRPASDYPPANGYPVVQPQSRRGQREVIEMQPIQQQPNSYSRRTEPSRHMTNQAIYIEEQPDQYTVQGRRGYGWSTGLFDCASDMGVCCFGYWLHSCHVLYVSNRAGENACAGCCYPTALRAKIRERYKIEGELCEDCFIVSCCGPCAFCQMHREMDIRNPKY